MTFIDCYLKSVTIGNDMLRLSVAPDIGASILAFDYVGDGAPIPVFRETPRRIADAFDCSMFVMLPWVNRISGGGITAGGTFYKLDPNVAGDMYPNHGNGFQWAWQVLNKSEASMSLGLRSDGPGPYAYDARYDLDLLGATLSARLEITSRSPFRLPFGAGFHPWLPRTSQTTLKAFARQVWLEDERHIPTLPLPPDEVPDFDFRSSNTLPKRWINNSFLGWDGIAEIGWPERRLRLVVSSPDASCYHVYSPGSEAPFMCFETETHIPDAANLLKEEDLGSPAWLCQGEMLVHQCDFSVGR